MDFLLAGEETPCAPATLRRLDARQAEVTLTEGRYHQVRRMFAAQGCEVLELDRIEFAGLKLGELARGQWIELPINHFDNI